MRKISIILLLLFVATGVFAGVQVSDNGIIFTFDAPNAHNVYLAGSMNDWNTTATKMEKNEDGIWEVILKLDAGKYTYKYVVDDNWLFDQDNSQIEDDGYGGSNSVVEVGSSGSLVQKMVKNEGVKSTMNPKVYFVGRFISNNVFTPSEDDRFMLQKPNNDLDLGIKVKLNSNFDVYTLLNVNNINEETDMWKTHFKYKKAYLRLQTDLFYLTAFDHHGVVTFDDPLHILGYEGIRHYDFGYGFRGIYASTNDFKINLLKKYLDHSLNLKLVYSDEMAESEADIGAARITAFTTLNNTSDNELELKVGGASYIYRVKESEELLQEHNSYEIDAEFTKKIFSNNWKQAMKIIVNGEFYAFKNTNLGDEDIKWMDGNTIYTGTIVEFPQALKLNLNFKNSKISFIDVDQDFMRNTISFGFNLSLGDFSASIAENFKITEYPDSLISWSDYINYMEISDANGRWFQKFSDLSFSEYTLLGYEKASLLELKMDYHREIFGRNFQVMYEGDIAQYDLFHQAKYIENILELQYDISKNWTFSTNTRIPFYNDEFLGLKTEFSDGDDAFISNYTQIAYHLSENVKLELGYGVKPQVINLVTNEYYDNGREDFMTQVVESYDLNTAYGTLGEKIRTAEQALDDDKQFEYN